MSNTRNPKSERAEVYEALDGERAYQNERWDENNSSSAGQHSYEEWLIYLRSYIRQAEDKLAHSGTQETQIEVGHIFRKITAMGVAAMEQHGAQFRDQRALDDLQQSRADTLANDLNDDEIPF